MSNKEADEFVKKLNAGLELAEKRMVEHAELRPKECSKANSCC